MLDLPTILSSGISGSMWRSGGERLVGLALKRKVAVKSGSTLSNSITCKISLALTDAPISFAIPP